jgi:hypothetical protein
MAYATIDQLAEALHGRVTAANTQLLTDCLEAAAEEIDQYLDRIELLDDPPPASVVRCNVDRAVEWYKAADAAYGMIGFDQIGVLRAPTDGFARHGYSIIRHKQQWAVA